MGHIVAAVKYLGVLDDTPGKGDRDVNSFDIWRRNVLIRNIVHAIPEQCVVLVHLVKVGVIEDAPERLCLLAWIIAIAFVILRKTVISTISTAIATFSASGCRTDPKLENESIAIFGVMPKVRTILPAE